MNEPRFLVHQSPVWRDKANFIIHAEIPDVEPPPTFEQLWARQVGEDRFEICCIPAYVYDLALGDVVVTSSKDSRKYVVERLEFPSGRYAFRAWLEKMTHGRTASEAAAERTALIRDMESIGALVELVSPSLLAIDAADAQQAKTIADYLFGRECDGDLQYETAKQS